MVSKEQHVHIEVEQVRDGEEHRLQHLGLGAHPDEQVHRPIRLVLIHCGQPGDHGDARSSPGRGEFEALFDRPVATNANSSRSAGPAGGGSSVLDRPANAASASATGAVPGAIPGAVPGALPTVIPAPAVPATAASDAASAALK